MTVIGRLSSAMNWHSSLNSEMGIVLGVSSAREIVDSGATQKDVKCSEGLF